MDGYKCEHHGMRTRNGIYIFIDYLLFGYVPPYPLFGYISLCHGFRTKEEVFAVSIL